MGARRVSLISDPWRMLSCSCLTDVESVLDNGSSCRSIMIKEERKK